MAESWSKYASGFARNGHSDFHQIKKKTGKKKSERQKTYSYRWLDIHRRKTVTDTISTLLSFGSLSVMLTEIQIYAGLLQ